MKKKLVLIAILLTLILKGFGQNTKIYFLADTIGIDRNNRVLEIKPIDAIQYGFIFFCKCVPPYKYFPTFSYLRTKKVPASPIMSKKPDYRYISFKELMEITAKYNIYFDKSYDLYITEVLPGNGYRTTKVKYEPTYDLEPDVIRIENK